MRIESSGDEEQVGREIVERRQYLGEIGLAHRRPAAPRLQRAVDDIAHAGLAGVTGAGKQRHFVARGIKDAGIVLEDILRPIAVMHVEIDDRHPLRPIFPLRLPCRDSNGIDQAKPHGC